MSSSQTILIIFLILLLARVGKAYNLGSNKVYQLPRKPRLLALLLLALIMAINILRSERPLLRGLLALPFSNLCFFIILNYYKTILTILLTAQLKNTIITIIIRTVRMLWIKAKLRTTTTETTTAAIQIMMTLGMAIAVIAIGAIRPTGVQGDKDR